MKYQDVTESIQFELLVDDVQLVILKPRRERGPEANLVGFRPWAEMIWRLPPPIDSSDVWDGFVKLWIRAGQVWVSSWSGFSLRIGHRNGKVVEQVFTK